MPGPNQIVVKVSILHGGDVMLHPAAAAEIKTVLVRVTAAVGGGWWWGGRGRGFFNKISTKVVD